MQKNFVATIVLAFLFGPLADVDAQSAHRITGNVESVVDGDLSDEFDFGGAYGVDFDLKFAIHPDQMELLGNVILDGGSRTTYSGVNLTDLRFDGGMVDILDDLQSGQLVYWDRVDFSQRILELNFIVGGSSISLVFTADQNNSDGAFDQLFSAGTPKANVGPFNPLGFSDASEADKLFTNPQVVIEAGRKEFGGAGTYLGSIDSQFRDVFVGDVNLDDKISLLDVAPFIDLIIGNTYQPEGDINL